MENKSRNVALSLFASLCLLTAGCHSQGAAPAASGGPVKHYPLSGKVVGTDSASGEVEVAGAAVPGFMDAMTMAYKLKDPSALQTLYQGDEMTGTLDVDGHGTVLDNVKVTSRAHEHKDPMAQSQMKPMTSGEAVPNFALTDQDGKTVHMADWRGKLLLMTFVYTHCPLSDYCPRMSKYFATIDAQLQKDPKLYAGTHLLSVSFDPTRDTPAVLRSYGGAYTGKYTHETFDHWTFAAPPQEELKDVLQFFDVDTLPGDGGTLTHTLSTILMDGNGKIVKWYSGNDWTPEQVIGDLRGAAGATR